MTDGELRGWFIALVALLILNFVRAFFPAYLGKKGQNLADKEDIAKITREIESVKSEYALVVERFKAENLLRFAALDKRLQAHQDAYELWRNIRSTAPIGGKEGREMFSEVFTRCQIFWEKSCLYLEPEARDAFSKAYLAGRRHALTVDSTRAEAGDILLSTYQDIEQCGEVLIRAVRLPGLLGIDAKPDDEE